MTTMSLENTLQAFRDTQAEERASNWHNLQQSCLQSLGKKVLAAGYGIEPLYGAILSPPGRQVVTFGPPLERLVCVTGRLGPVSQEKVEVITAKPGVIVGHYAPYGYWLPLTGITDLLVVPESKINQ